MRDLTVQSLWDDAAWRDTLSGRPNTLTSLYAPLIEARDRHGAMVIGQIGQSLDGRIATAEGHSHYINGPAALVHLHRLRALADAVVVGAGTVAADDPRLTARRASATGQPARVVIDPGGRVPEGARVWQNDGARRIAIQRAGRTRPAGVEIVEWSVENFSPAKIVSALAERGLRRLLIEGGADTLSRFVEARVLHRLHVMVAPLIIGSGKRGIELPPASLAAALRPETNVFALPGGDVLFDCILQ